MSQYGWYPGDWFKDYRKPVKPKPSVLPTEHVDMPTPKVPPPKIK